jgi:cation transport ATPase
MTRGFWPALAAGQNAREKDGVPELLSSPVSDAPSAPSAAPLRARPPRGAPPRCAHCGAPTAADEEYCCAGCAFVSRLIRDEGLGDFYALKDKVTPPADGALEPARDFAWLGEAARAAEAEAAPRGRAAELELGVQGMSCAACGWLIERLHKRHAGAGEIEASAETGRVRLRWVPGAGFDAVGFARELQRFGYLVGPGGGLDREESEARGLARKAGLAGALAMNAMMAALPYYFGMSVDFEYARLFEAAGLLFATLSVFACGSYFLGRAVAALRARLLHLDLPIALGIVGAYLGSSWGWLTGNPEAQYFDFVTGFIALMLTGRWAQVAAVERNRRRLLKEQPVASRVRVWRPRTEPNVRNTNIGSGAGTGSAPRAEAGGEAGNVRNTNIGFGGGRDGFQSAEAVGEAGNVRNTNIGAGCGREVFQGEKARGEGGNVRITNIGSEVGTGSAPRAEAGGEGGNVRNTNIGSGAGAGGAGWVEEAAEGLVEEEAAEALVEAEAGSLVAGERFVVAAGSRVPVEARLEAEQAEFSLAWITGEAEPRLFRAGQRVPAGALLAGGGATVEFTATQGWEGSLLAELSRPVERAPERARLIERVVKWYLVGILGAALGAGLWWGWRTGDAARTGAVVISILVVSCPCALGLAFPLAEEIATVRLRRRGVFVRAGELWQRLNRVRTVVFDKTGTLTCETPALADPEALDGLGSEARAALLALVRDNPHPVGRALHEAILLRGWRDAALAGEVVEEIGRGVRLGEWRLERGGAELCGGAADAVLRGAEGVVARFRFVEAVRGDARAELAALRRRGLGLAVLSGDRDEKVAALAAELGVAAEWAKGGLDPREKAAWLETHAGGGALMLGDGANDSLAFDRALCRGTPAVHRGVLGAKSDFYYLGRGIGGVRALLEVNDARRSTQTALLVFMIGYNAAAVGLAATGHMNPLFAAVLMPLSSLATLAIVWIGLRSARV